MCGRKSNNGSKRMLVFFLVFALLGCQLFAASPWYAFWPKKTTEESEKVSSSEKVEEVVETAKEEEVVAAPVLKTEPVAETEESSPVPSMTASETPSETSSLISDEALSNLETEFTNYLSEVSGYVSEVETLRQLSEKLQAQLDALQQTEAISEEEYQTVKASLLTTVEANEAQAARLAELENEAKTKAFALGGAFIGFEDSVPLWGLSGTVGVRFGSNVMTSVGVDYEMGSMSTLWKPTLDLDNLRVRAQVGWMW